MLTIEEATLKQDKSEGVMAPLGPIVAKPVVEFYVHVNEQTQQYICMQLSIVNQTFDFQVVWYFKLGKP